ncbi:MAG TPA: antibiotic biosynthesis monooxygenase [Candidatus Sumerlaeota bacterium]|nr:antibiotic biosynthesis monooxygenase [Candidatus Sumerlaeota bacterium]HOR27323.1 antibiotic biosynthesis monooxygenase [Candidatus Sumerlaeota bacterium]HPK02945.1 antibiotic biosynthesis monooxygenase [Candidatus Sumerlaeota bacterium]
MFVVCVTVWVREAYRDAFIAATLENARNTRGEPGNLRFDVLQAVDDPNRFFLYEVYVDEAAFAEHQQTAHYFAWRDTVADWMAQKRQGVKHRALDPADATAWTAQA